MKEFRLIGCITVICLFGIFASAALSKTIKIGEAEVLYTEDELPIWYDCSLSTIQKDADTMYFFHSFGCRFEPEEKRRSRHSWHSGPARDPFKVHEMSKTEEAFWDYNGFYKDTDQEGIWILAMYKRENGDLLGITHSEIDFATKKLEFHFSIGLAYSTDEGRSWEYCGEIIRPADDRTNIGGGAYVIAGEYLYVYFNDTDMPDDAGAFNSEAAERQGRRQCVARARLDEVLEKAAKHEVGQWFKYKDGKWDVPGLSKAAGEDLIPNVYGAEDLHSDAAYCTELGKYLLTVQTHGAHKLVLFSSADGIKWEQEAIVDETEENVMQPYSSFVDYDGPAADCHEVDGSFYIYYPHKQLAGPENDYMYRRLVTIE